MWNFCKSFCCGILSFFQNCNRMLEATAVLENAGLLMLRLVLGGAMLGHGITKFNDFHGQIHWLQEMLLASGMPQWMAYLVILGEVIAPIMIILGLFTRLGSFIIAGNMLFVIFLAHSNELFALNQYGFVMEVQYLLLAISVYLVIAGGGRYAPLPRAYR